MVFRNNALLLTGTLVITQYSFIMFVDKLKNKKTIRLLMIPHSEILLQHNNPNKSYSVQSITSTNGSCAVLNRFNNTLQQCINALFYILHTLEIFPPLNI